MASRAKTPLLAAAMAVLQGLIFAPRAYGWSGRAVAVESGCRITVERKAGRVKVVLYGIQCPATGQPFGNDALYLTCWLVLGKRVEVTPVGLESGTRIAALVKAEGSSEYLNSLLIGYGMARLKNPHPVLPLCVQWEKREHLAKINMIGLWASRTHPGFRKKSRANLYSASPRPISGNMRNRFPSAPGPYRRGFGGRPGAG